MGYRYTLNVVIIIDYIDSFFDFDILMCTVNLTGDCLHLPDNHPTKQNSLFVFYF